LEDFIFPPFCVNLLLIEALKDRIRQLLNAHGLKLNTDLGQHFLVDENVLEAILQAGDPKPGERVIEIGPGVGALTKELLAKGALVTAIELDTRLLQALSVYTYEFKDQLTVIQGNALQTPFPSESYKVIANIPYHITSPLLRHAFLESKVRPTSLTLLIQREVAEKICDTESAGMLTIIVGLFGKPRIIRTVPPGCFLPPPKVDSAVLHIDTHPEPMADADTIEAIFKLTRVAFGQKRKMLRNTLGSIEGGMEKLQKIGVDPTRRPETLSIPEWIALSKEF
jgi:16S rRNA (adenine1518-N6/adenine1519-N6)-dimethyltransferase